jgi:hypothetical protein
MKILPALLGIFLATWLTVDARQTSQLTGTVLEIDAENPLIGANVYWASDPQKGVVTDKDGKFILPVITLPSRLVVSYLGYEISVRVITEKDLGKPQKFFLKPEPLSLEEITISENIPYQNVVGIDMGRSRVPIETIKNIPALFGEVDLLRGLQLLPGVQTAGEGTTGLFVRGGSADQNLILLDGAPVYNPSHFFGFFSVFSPDALAGVDFYKGNIPAQFGGRASSVIDVGLKEGNYQKIKGEGGIGTISSRLTIDGPLFSDKSSFVVSGRRTYADLFLRLSDNEDIRNNDLYFYDLSGKFAFRLGDKDKLTLSSYYGSDYLGLSGQFGLGWNNWISSLTWSRAMNEQSFFDLNAYHSYYRYDVGFEDDDSGFNWFNVLSESGVKGDWTWLPAPTKELKWGFHSQYYNFTPINLLPSPGNAIEPIVTNPRNGIQHNLFISGSTDLSDKFRVEAGLRWNVFQQIGRGVNYIYEEGIPSPDAVVVDTVRFGRFQNMKLYQGLEPRVSLRWLLGTDFSLKAAFNRNYQYVQVASNSSAGLPIDRWILAGTYFQPVIADQSSVGLFKNLNEDTWELSLEGYYKDFQNVVDIRQGANVLFSDNVETDILSGRGFAYGVEALAKKNRGKTTGWISYTYSRTWRKIIGISKDSWFNPRFDRPHDLTMVMNHEFSKRWSAGLTFVYSTGQAVSFPIGSYEVDFQVLPLYGPLRNTERFPDYHRMDASVTWKNTDKGRKWRGSWNFSVYNLYGRKNPFAYQFTEIINGQINFSAATGEKIVSRRPGVVMTYLFTFLPALTYNFNF